MPQRGSLKDNCDFCGQRAVSFTAACGFHKTCIRCNVRKRATASCSACLSHNTKREDDNSDLTGNNDEWEELVRPGNKQLPSWLVSGAPSRSRRPHRVSTFVRTRLPSPVKTTSPTPPEPDSRRHSSAGSENRPGDTVSDNSTSTESETAPAEATTPRVRRKPRRLRGQIASQIGQKTGRVLKGYSPMHNPAAASEQVSRSGMEIGASNVAGWRTKTPGAIMHSELQGIPSMYCPRRRRIPWQFQSFVNLGERCAMMWREQTGHSPPHDDDSKDVVGQGDVTQPDMPDDDASEFGLGYVELEVSDDSEDDDESIATFSNPESERENNTSPCKAENITYDRSWVVPDGSQKYSSPTGSDDDLPSDFVEIEGPCFSSDADDRRTETAKNDFCDQVTIQKSH